MDAILSIYTIYSYVMRKVCTLLRLGAWGCVSEMPVVFVEGAAARALGAAVAECPLSQP